MTQRSEEISYDRWVWVDLEMTGLDDESCVILQAAMIITDPHFKVLCEVDIPIWQPESALSTMIPIVKSMHTKNNLLERVRTSQYSLMQAEQELMSHLVRHVGYQKGILAGNSMYVDRRFLRRYMPSFESFLHYRQIDVSSLKLISQAWYGAKGRPPKKANSHTALEDIRDSIEELKFYQQNIFRHP
ncbi:MAG: oligoribonuclease [Myxococcales bacterium]|nr:oligoribonuclease [Myxococcales bacterium]USN51398.1 MAG: oligoribonuclease [Myxococcales bacterium]